MSRKMKVLLLGRKSRHQHQSLLILNNPQPNTTHPLPPIIYHPPSTTPLLSLWTTFSSPHNFPHLDSTILRSRCISFHDACFCHFDFFSVLAAKLWRPRNCWHTFYIVCTYTPTPAHIYPCYFEREAFKCPPLPSYRLRCVFGLIDCLIVEQNTGRYGSPVPLPLTFSV
jgi:hypothetical protein